MPAASKAQARVYPLRVAKSNHGGRLPPDFLRLRTDLLFPIRTVQASLSKWVGSDFLRDERLTVIAYSTPTIRFMHTTPSSYSTPTLLIEPDPTLALRFQELLTTDCCPVLDLGKASSFQEGLTYLRTHQVTLVLMNLVLPDATGRQAVHLLRQTANSSALIGFSRHPDTSLLLDAIRAGAHDVLLAIPPSAESLGLSIQSALIRANRTLRVEGPPPPVVSRPTAPMPLSKVAHDLNNSLTSIKGFADILLARLSAADPSRHCAEQIQHACAKAEVLIKQLSGSPAAS
jgi:DNA-binding response OmpR family regulator